ncbi:hypothetical protein GCM10011513_38620 [Franconibacter daqui]|nr:hypothetical protein GCM10011513_38620 [Franconibacter daqui]
MRETIMPPSSKSTISAARRTSALKIMSPFFPGGLNAGFVAAISHSFSLGQEARILSFFLANVMLYPK